jgi:GTP-binding protein HflX
VDFKALSDAFEKKNGIKPVFMAAASGLNVEEFREALLAEVKKQHRKIYPHYLEDEVVDWTGKGENVDL